MEWFYRLDGKETGPISVNDLKALFKDRTITAETKVRRADLAEWQPLRRFVKGAPPSPPPQAPAPTEPQPEIEKSAPSPPTEAASDAPGAAPRARCTECGRAYDPDDLIRFDDARICAACKPLFTQKLREGVSTQTTLVYGGFWIRFGAKFIDSLLIIAVNMAIGFVFGFSAGMIGLIDGSGESLMIDIFVQLMNIVVPAIYATFFLGRYGATLGKMACGLKVVRPDGGPISYPRALGRYFAEILSGMILGIGYLMAAFDSEKRSLHDRICSTRVVRK